MATPTIVTMEQKSFLPAPPDTGALDDDDSYQVTINPRLYAYSMMKASSPSSSYSLSSASFSSICTPFLWNPTFVPILPECYHLERTSIFIPNMADRPSVVAGRISNVLRERSIEAHYDDELAKVKCMTVEGVDFRIRLYRNRSTGSGSSSIFPKRRCSRSSNNKIIIVEIQRRFGTSLTFHDDITAILNGAEGKVVPPALMMNNNCLPNNFFEDVDGDKEKDEENNDDGNADCDDDNASFENNAETTMGMVEKLLKYPGFDSQYLALKTLSLLVDPEKLSSLSVARFIATKLLQNGNNEVSAKVFSYIVNSNTSRNGSNRNINNNENNNSSSLMIDDDEKSDDDDDDHDGNDDDDNRRILRNMCLNILSNSLRSMNKGTVRPLFVVRNKPLLRRALLEDLKNAEQSPNTAYLSANCMEYFVVHAHHDAVIKLYNQAFEIALKVGEERHTKLFRQAQKCMMIMAAR